MLRFRTFLLCSAVAVAALVIGVALGRTAPTTVATAPTTVHAPADPIGGPVPPFTLGQDNDRLTLVDSRGEVWSWSFSEVEDCTVVPG